MKTTIEIRHEDDTTILVINRSKFHAQNYSAAEMAELFDSLPETRPIANWIQRGRIYEDAIWGARVCFEDAEWAIESLRQRRDAASVPSLPFEGPPGPDDDDDVPF